MTKAKIAELREIFDRAQGATEEAMIEAAGIYLVQDYSGDDPIIDKSRSKKTGFRLNGLGGSSGAA